MMTNPLLEKLAAAEHERWSDWQAWCHKILRENCPSPELEAVLARWDLQIATHYDQLTEKEKQSDRDQVVRYIPLIKEHLLAILKDAKDNSMTPLGDIEKAINNL